MGKRAYRQTRRREQQERTRARIVQATMELHEELGPARTTVSAIAERAGVERLTVYRHFPDERELFRACSGRFVELHPPPTLSSAAEGVSPEERARELLRGFYRYYRQTADMWKKVYRDLELVPANADVTAEFESYLDGIRDSLARSLAPSGNGRRRIRAALGHALRFATWESLEREGLGDGLKATSMLKWIEALRLE